MKGIIFFVLLLPFWCKAQIINDVKKAKLNSTYKKYLPKNYSILDTAMGDFNKDEKTDIVLVIDAKEQTDKQRGIIILEGIGTGYKINTTALKAMRLRIVVVFLEIHIVVFLLIKM